MDECRPLEVSFRCSTLGFPPRQMACREAEGLSFVPRGSAQEFSDAP